MAEKTGSVYNKRSSYIKYTKKPYRYKKAYRSKNTSENRLELFLTQCIVSGIILFAALAVCIIKTPFTQNLRSDIKTAVSGGVSGDGSAGNVWELAQNAGNSIKALILGREKEVETTPDEENEVVPAFNPSEKDFRIDEDILKEIHNENTGTSYGEIKNNLAPQE